jgi:amino acid transporter
MSDYDEVNKPVGYNYHNNDDAEAIAVIAALGLLFPFCIGNAIKYICRYKVKGGRKDLEKTLWYLKKAIQPTPKISSLNSVQLATIWNIHSSVAKDNDEY